MKMKYIFFIVLILLVILFYCINISTFGNTKEEEAYRLGDVYLQADDLDTVVENLEYHITKYPGSIAAEILKVKPYKRKNKELLLKILETKQKYTIKDDELVLHIRAGDVLCIENQRFRWYSKIDDTEWWDRVVEYMQEHSIKKVYIVSGSHRPLCKEETDAYIKDRVQFFKNLGYSVETRLDKSPDDDFIFCLSAKHFISTGGGFGRMIYELNNNWF
jgi:hypothetical protein